MRKNNKGNVLLVTLVLVVVAGSIVGMIINQTSTVAQNANRSREYQAAQSAANGAVEYAYGVWLRRINSKHDLISSASDLAVTGPGFSGSNALNVGTSGTMELAYTTSGSLTIHALDKYGRVCQSGSNPSPVIGSVKGYPGWWGRTYIYAATAQLQTTDGKVKAGARRLFYYTEVPLFQCMFFFQDDLELYNPAKITINGLIHTNGDLYLSAQQSSWLTLYSNATYSGTYYPISTGEESVPPGARNTVADIGVLKDPTWENDSAASQVTSISAMGDDFEAIFSDTNYSGNANVSGSFHELIEPAASGTDPLSDKRLCNVTANTEGQTGDLGGVLIYITGTTITASSIEITSLDSTTHLPTISNTACTVHIGVGAGASISNTTALINALVTGTSTSTAISKKLAQSGSSIITGTSHLYDDRENLYMNVVDINMSALQSAINTYVEDFSNIIYLYDDANPTSTAVTTSTSRGWPYTVTTSTTTYTSENVVRLLNGSNITSDDGLTIVSYNPVYIQGDYNTGGTGNNVPSNKSSSDGSTYTTGTYVAKPTSIVADAISLLSNSWSDSNSANSLSYRDASNTTYNVAMLGGYILSSTSSSSNTFSGGAINYPRFLEDWGNGSIYCTYYGSMVELFPSLTSTNRWVQPGSSGAYYSAPSRRFNFDTQFSYKSPPGSVNAVILSRGIWTPWSPD